MASKKMEALKTAGADMDKFFSGASQKPSEPVKKTTVGRSKAKAEKAPKEPQKAEKSKKKVFSFRAEETTVDSWRLWADAKGMKVDELGTLALTEYIKKHSLTADQKKIYDLKLAQKKS